MRALRFSAPGKLYLLGEYAVLHGAPALLAAIDSRVSVTLTESDAAWSLTAPQLGIDRLILGDDGSLPEVLDASLRHQLGLFDEVRKSVDALTPATAAFTIAIESADFVRNGHKLGLGSSAAVAVAVTAALAAGREASLTLRALFTLAARAHSAAQGGKGSGGDIAASVFGGTILYRQGSEPHSVSFPPGLDFFAVLTGTGSSTVDLVSRVAEYAEQDPEGSSRDLDHLCELAERTETALETADSFLALADDYFRGVERLDSHSQAGIVTDRHRELRELAARQGAVFKTSGAGGGDVGLVFAKLDSTDQIKSAFTDVGATVIPAPFSPDGVRMEPA